MTSREPSADKARAALAEAAVAQTRVAASDRGFALLLLAIAAATVILASLLALFGLLPPWSGPLQGFLAMLGLAGVTLLVVLSAMRLRAYTRWANRLFVVVLLVWIAWGEAVEQFSFRSAWLDHNLPGPVRSIHLVISAVIAVVPLLAGALLFIRRR